MPPRSWAAMPLLPLNNGQLTSDCVRACVPCLQFPCSAYCWVHSRGSWMDTGWSRGESVEHSWVTLQRCQTVLGSLQDSHQHEDWGKEVCISGISCHYVRLSARSNLRKKKVRHSSMVESAVHHVRDPVHHQAGDVRPICNSQPLRILVLPLRPHVYMAPQPPNTSPLSGHQVFRHNIIEGVELGLSHPNYSKWCFIIKDHGFSHAFESNSYGQWTRVPPSSGPRSAS